MSTEERGAGVVCEFAEAAVLRLATDVAHTMLCRRLGSMPAPDTDDVLVAKVHAAVNAMMEAGLRAIRDVERPRDG